MLKQIEHFLFYLLFFAIPFQTRKILYSPGWYFNEWQAISIYATDILLVALFIFWIFHSSLNKYRVSNLKHIGNLKTLILKPDFWLVLFLVVAGVSIKNSSDFYSGFFLWLKLLEFALFYFYLKTYAVRKFDLVGVFYVLIAGGVFQAIIAMAQFMKQGDLGLRWFGESVIGPHMTGIASFFIASGEKIIRAYGTTPHPNILAAYMFLAMLSYYFIYLYLGFSHNSAVSKRKSLSLNTAYLLMLFGFFFTFSRVIIFAWFGSFILRAAAILSKERLRKQLFYMNNNLFKLVQILSVSLVVIVIFSFLYWPEVSARARLSSDEEAVQLRTFYNKESLEGGINLFGIGLGDFTAWLMEQNPNLPRYVYQPVHNIYLLLYSEVGIIGLILFLAFLLSLLCEFIKKTRLSELKHFSFLLVVLSILFTGLFDHFLLTIQQGRFVFWLSLTLLAISDTIGKSSERR